MKPLLKYFFLRTLTIHPLLVLRIKQERLDENIRRISTHFCPSYKYGKIIAVLSTSYNGIYYDSLFSFILPKVESKYVSDT